MGRVSRNLKMEIIKRPSGVAPRMGRVSRNEKNDDVAKRNFSRAPHGACE